MTGTPSIAALRVASHFAPAGGVAAVVSRLGAIQAQDPAMSRWAIGVRAPGVSEAAVRAALDRAEVIRTHVLRPTWHLVAAADVRWMLALTAPAIRRLVAPRLSRLGLEPSVLRRSERVIVRMLQSGAATRGQLVAALVGAGIPTADNGAAHLLMAAELDQVMCSGPAIGGETSYALMDTRVPGSPQRDPEEARRALAERYFSSHGPATAADFAWWSGSTLRQARAAAEDAAGLERMIVAGVTYWMAPGMRPAPGRAVHLLPAWDEFVVAYRDRSATLQDELAARAVARNGTFWPTVTVAGVTLGRWKATRTREGVRVAVEWFGERRARLQAPAQRYGAFLGRPVEVVEAGSAPLLP